MKVFSISRIAYIEDLDNDPGVQEALRAGSSDRFRFDIQDAPHMRAFWKKDSFAQEIKSGLLKFEHGGRVMKSSAARHAMLSRAPGKYFFKIGR